MHSSSGDGDSTETLHSAQAQGNPTQFPLTQAIASQF